MATPNIVPRADSEGGLGTASKYWASAYIDTITTTGNVDINGNLTVEDTIELTDGGSTVRGKLILNASDRDNVELRAESLGSTMKFFTVGTEALLLDGSQNATFAGAVNVSGEALTVTNGNSEKPLLHLKATNNSAAGPHIKFEVDRGAAPAVGDDLGTILWAGEDSNQNVHHYAKILGEILNPASTDEAGRLTLFVGESDGTTADLSPGLKLEGSSSVDGEVNVTIGNAVTSKTSIPGRLGVGANSTDVEAALTIKGDPGNTNQPAKITNSSQDTHTGLFLNSTGNAVNEKYGMQFGGFNEYSVGGIFGLIDSTSGSTSGDITIDMCDGTTANALIERVRFTHEGNVGVGITPVSRLHIYEDSAETGENAGITVEQDGTGDATIQFLLTGTRRWATGIDNSNSDAFTIASSGDLGSDGVLTLSTGGNATFSGDVNIADNSKLKFGDSADLEIFHDGSHSRIKDAGVGHLTINATDFVVNNSGDTKNMIIATDGGATSLYCDGSLKLATTSTGVTVTGTLNGIPFFTDTTNDSMYTHNPSGNTGYSGAGNNTAYGFTAMAAITTGDDNTAFGYKAGTAINTGVDNTIIGGNAGDALTSGSYNVAIGKGALSSEDTGGTNVAIGYNALTVQDGTGNSYNVAIGFDTGKAVSTGVENVIVGGSAGDAITTGSYNAVLGTSALGANVQSSGNVAIGNSALASHNTSTASSGYNIGIGFNAGIAVSTGTNNTIVGGLAGDGITLGEHNIALGYNSLSAANAGNKSVAIGSGALSAQQPSFTVGGASYAASGDATITHTANTNIVVGQVVTSSAAGIPSGATVLSVTDSTHFELSANTTSSQSGQTLTFTGGVDANNTAVGYLAGNSVTTGTRNTLIGAGAGDAINTGEYNVAVGYGALSTEDQFGYNVAVGTFSLLNQNAADNAFNTAVGYNTGGNITTGVRNTIMGGSAGDGFTTGSDNVVLGYAALSAANAGNRSVAIGSSALNAQNAGSAGVNVYNTAVGYGAGAAVTTGGENTIIGAFTGDALTTGVQNVAFGNGALGSETIRGKSVAIGYVALNAQTGAGSDSYNVAVGHSAGKLITTGINNTIIGGAAGDALQDDSNNTAVGANAMTNLQTDNCTAVGYAAMEGATTSTRTTAIGRTALGGAVLTGNDNTALGHQAGSIITSGAQNTLIGTKAGDALTTGDNNIVIGYEAAASAVGVNNEITLGDANISAFRCADQSIVALSDGRDKTDIKNSSYGLDFINTIRPVEFTWDFRPENMAEAKQGKKRVGFIAQELQEAMPNSENEILDLVYDINPDRIEAKYGNLIPILVKAVQELSEEVKALKNK